jgi:hypothetical protein
MLGLGLIALAFSFVEALNQVGPTIRQRIKRQVFLPDPKRLTYPVQE